MAKTPGLSSLARWLDSTPEVNRCGAEAFLQLASFHKELSWKQDYEADELACTLLARLRLTPDHMAAGMKALAAARADWHKQQLGWLLERWVLPSEEAKCLVEAKLGFPGDGLDKVLRRYEDTVKRGDVDAMDELVASFEASRTRHRLLELSEGSGAADTVAVGNTPVPTAMVTGRTACPEYAVRTVLADIAGTHPPYSARLERIRQLSGQLPMQLRAAAPSMAAVGGHYSHANVAERVAERLAEGMRAATAAKEAVKEAAAKEAAKEAAAKEAAKEAAAREQAAKEAAAREQAAKEAAAREQAAKEAAASKQGTGRVWKWLFFGAMCNILFGSSPPPVA